MENLLRNDFTAYYGLPLAIVANIYQETNEPYFEIEDDANQETQISIVPDSGQAVYNNRANRFLIGVINYDKFVTSLSHRFQQGKGRCDLIVYTKNNKGYFLLNELKDTNPLFDDEPSISTRQLEKSLTDLLNVPTIVAFVNTFTEKKCCFFNKRIQAPPPILAVTAFNRINTITVNGFQIKNAIIEALGFTFHKYYGGHQFILS